MIGRREARGEYAGRDGLDGLYVGFYCGWGPSSGRPSVGPALVIGGRVEFDDERWLYEFLDLV